MPNYAYVERRASIKNEDTEEILFIIVVTQIITTISNIAMLVKH